MEDLSIRELSERETTVLELMAQGCSNAAIERTLWVSAKTVETHVRSIYWKLGLSPSSTQHRRVLAVLMYLRAQPEPAHVSSPRLS